MSPDRRLPIGAELRAGAAHFRVWAPRHPRVGVVLESGRARGELDLKAEASGYFSGSASRAAAGDLYRFRLGGDGLFPDPASRFQPDGPHGPSQLVDPATFAWSDTDWPGVSLRGQVLYEMHIGTFTSEGTWAAAARRLPELAELGITVLEVMPVAAFPGRFGWGYDGVYMFAPTHQYGTPDDFRRFVDVAHAVKIGVILDVVYNHFGPDGNYLCQFASEYTTDRYKNEWGVAINFDGPGCEPVREYLVTNAGYWIDEFHLDGLRLDATQAIYDNSPEHILTAIGHRVREQARGRATIVIHENEPQKANYVRPVDHGGYGLDGMWNDDFHHAAIVAMTGRSEAYYWDYLGTPQEFISAAKYGYLFQGQRYSWQEHRRGSPALDVEPWRFVNFLQNHDQIANTGRGSRIHQRTSPGRLRAMTALLLLIPGTPMLFQGQEFAASTPFTYFADHKPELSEMVKAGRIEFLQQFRHLDHPRLSDEIADPADPVAFERCKLDHNEREANIKVYNLHKDLLALRMSEPAFRDQQPRGMDGAVLGSQAFVLRFFAGGQSDRLLLVNLGTDLHLDRAAEPLLAPPDSCGWKILWSSEDRRYGGDGTAPVETLDGWRLMGEAAVVLAPDPLSDVELALSWERANVAMKARKHRERTRLME